MLIVAGYFEVAPEQREEYIASRTAAMTKSRGEDGCYEYVFAADPIVPGRVVLYERWESKETLAAHISAMNAARAAAGETAPETAPTVTVLASEVVQYEIGAVGSLGS